MTDWIGADVSTLQQESNSVIYGLYCRCHSKKGIRYVGQTCRGMRQRWAEHVHYSKNGGGRTKVYQWMRAHDVAYRILEAKVPLEELDTREAFWIARYHTHERGMNLTPGGKWVTGGGVQRGSDNAYASLDEDKVREICALLSDGVRQHKIAERYGVSRGCVAGISRGESWRHVTIALLDPGAMGAPRTGSLQGEECGNSRLTPEQVDAIRETYAPLEGVTTKVLGERFGVSPITVQAVVRGATWKHRIPEGYTPAEKNTRPRAVITVEDAREIKRRLAGGGRGVGAALAREYGISPMAVSDIRRGATWADACRSD